MESVIRDSPIIDGLTYQRPNLKDFTLDDNDLTRTCPLDYYRHNIDPRHDLGTLDTLPLELLGLILIQIDIRSLTDFRRINNRAMQVVDPVVEYRLIRRHTPDLIRGILSIEIGSHISVQALFKTLNESRCEDCGDFAGYIYLLTCKRVCFLCLYEKPRYFPLSIFEAARQFGVPRRLLVSLPAIKSIPGCYSPNEYKRKARFILVDSESARKTGLAHYKGNAPLMDYRVATAELDRMHSWRMEIMREEYIPRRRPGRSVRETPVSDARRFIRAPWIRPPTNAVGWGFHCVGCKEHHVRRLLHWRRKYCVETFSHHIEQCGRVHDGKHHLDGNLGVVR
jgi:hypothetical protein